MKETPPPLIRSLAKPGALPGSTKPARLIQTQMSWVLVSEKFAYKVKKPVNLGYLDYTTLSNREFFCRQEVELNRRMCPEAYLGVVKISLENGQYVLNGKADAVEYAVKMVKLPSRCMLDYLLAHNEVAAGMIDEIALKVAGFHERASTSEYISSFGSLESVRTNALENFDQTEAYIPGVISRSDHERIKNFTVTFLQNNAHLFKARVDKGHIKDCHGDMHSSHICFTNGLCIYDCIEFADRFRYIDTASEIAFLAMDLDCYARADLSYDFIDRYIRASEDIEAAGLVGFYKCYRAMVRAKVNCFKLDDPYVGHTEKIRSKRAAEKYFSLAKSYTLDRPLLLVNVGLVGTGKSTLARALAGRMGMVVISSDVVRKTLAGIPLTERSKDGLDQGIYAPHFSRLTYESMFDQAKQWLSRKTSVILDATFTMSASRSKARRLASETGARFILLEYRLSEKEILHRLGRREKSAGSISDAGVDVYLKMKRGFQPPGKKEKGERVIINSNQRLDTSIHKVERFIYDLER